MELIFDRTQEDVRERNEKGTYNTQDLNRVESAAQALSADMLALPDVLHVYAAGKGVSWAPAYDIPYSPEEADIETKTDWQMGDIPTISDMDRYLGNIKALCAVLGLPVTGLPVTMEYLNYVGANRIESYLARAIAEFASLKAEKKRLIDNTAAAWPYAGDFYAGEA